MENIKLKNPIVYLDKSLLYFSITCLIISVIGAMISVIFRYFLNTSFQILEEICRYAIVYGVFAYIAPLIKQKAHLKMDVLSNVFKGKLKYSINLFNSIFLFGVFAFLLWSSVNWTLSLLDMKIMTVTGTMLLFIPTIAVPIGMFLGCLYSLIQIVNDIYQFFQHKIIGDRI